LCETVLDGLRLYSEQKRSGVSFRDTPLFPDLFFARHRSLKNGNLAGQAHRATR
jgi:hypothetical protein